MRSWIEYKISTLVAFSIIFLIIIPAGFLIFKSWENTMNAIEAETQITTSVGTKKITETEEEQIQKWIAAENLNQYGDPEETIYAGGTPLFNELTGEQIDLYDYILERHPDRPWKK